MIKYLPTQRSVISLPVPNANALAANTVCRLETFYGGVDTHEFFADVRIDAACQHATLFDMGNATLNFMYRPIPSCYVHSAEARKGDCSGQPSY